MVLAAAAVGTGIGTFTGMVPGIHVNTATTMMAAGAPSFAAAASGLVPDGMGMTFVCCCIMSAATVHSFVDFVPSVFLGAPDADEVLSILPGHCLLLEGRGMDAVKAAAVGSAVGSGTSLMLAIPMQWVMLHGGVGFLDMVTTGAVAFACAAVVLSSRRIGVSFILMGASAVLGYVAADPRIPVSGILGEGTLLFPLLTGLFGIPPLLDGSGGSETPAQGKACGDPVGPGPGIRGVATGLVAGWFPGITSTVGATIASVFGEEKRPEDFISLTASIGTVTSVFAVVALSVTGSGRSGAAVAVKDIAGGSLYGFCSEAFILILACMAFASALGYVSTMACGRAMCGLMGRIPTDALEICVLILIVALVLASTGPCGLILLAVSAAVGTLPPALGTGRVCLTGCLLVPTLFAGLNMVRKFSDGYDKTINDISCKNNI